MSDVICVDAKHLVGNLYLARMYERLAVEAHGFGIDTRAAKRIEVTKIQVHAIQDIQIETARHQDAALQGIA